MQILVLKQVQRELRDLPKDVTEDVFSLFDDLASGKTLGMPISRPLPSVLHATQKKKQELDKKTRELLLNRLRSI